MNNNLHIYNTLSRKKEKFEPINPPFVGLYVCGPTVYGEAHLGHARPAITFDVLFRLLKHLDYKVRYIRNITDVGHLENDADSGEDKISKKARLEELEPMEVSHFYTENYHSNMRALNVLSPSIEPLASGHIIEQLEMIDEIMNKGFAYESNGSVYFDVKAYNESHNYGKLSGRNIKDLLNTTRALDGQEEKRNSFDFALWKKASPEHIMRWSSKYSDGFPGWHMECSAMGRKYLGKQFDIHGGGMDLKFPHHECEIAQSTVANGKEAVKYWMHNNMITINGQKMGKSLGNFITLQELFSGKHNLLEQAYSPMTIRFFILQAHYRSTLDFSNEALQAAQKGFDRLIKATQSFDKIKIEEHSTVNINALSDKLYTAIFDDLNTPIAIAHLFDVVKIINNLITGNETINQSDFNELKSLFSTFVFDIFGLVNNEENEMQENHSSDLVELLLNMRQEAKNNKNWATADEIRDQLKAMGITIKDGKGKTEWSWD